MESNRLDRENLKFYRDGSQIVVNLSFSIREIILYGLLIGYILINCIFCLVFHREIAIVTGRILRYLGVFNLLKKIRIMYLGARGIELHDEENNLPYQIYDPRT